MIEPQKKDIPPGLLRIVRRNKPSKKFFLLLGISSFLIISGFVAIYFYNVYYPFDSKIQTEKRPLLTAQNIQSFNQQTETTNQKAETQKMATISEKKKSINSADSQKYPSEKIKKNQQSLSFTKNQKEIPFMSIDTFKGADYLYRAQDLEKKGALLEAINEYKEYINYTGKVNEKILNKIATLYLLLGNLKEAEHYSELAMKSNQNNKEVLINYGVIKAKTGAIDKAEECFNKVLSLEPDNKNALFNLALLKEKKGQYKEALSLYEKLYNLGDSTVAASIDRLKNYK